MLFRDYIFLIYVTKESILDKMHQISNMFVVALASFLLKDVFCCILIGIGIQHKTMAFNVLSYVLLGTPLSIFCTFWLEWYYSGPWIGITVCLSLNAGYYYFLYKSHDIQQSIDDYKRKHHS